MEAIIDRTGLTAARDDLGSVWENFEDGLIPEQADQLNYAYNLISAGFKENSLSLMISTFLIDENIESATRINLIRRTLITGIIELLNQVGIIIDLDYVTLDSLAALSVVLDTLYQTERVEDVYGVMDILDNETYDNKDKLIATINTVMGLEETDDSELLYLIQEVSGDTIKGLYLGLDESDDDNGDYLNPDIARRIKANRTFLTGTLAASHIVNGGQAGLPYLTLFRLLIDKMEPVILDDKRRYLKEILAICLISSMTSHEIEEGYEEMVVELCQSLNDMTLPTQLLEQVVL